MRIPEHQNYKYNLSPWLKKDNRVQKVHEDQFENELEDSIKKRKSAEKKRTKKASKEVDLKSETQKGERSANNSFSSWS